MLFGGIYATIASNSVFLFYVWQIFLVHQDTQILDNYFRLDRYDKISSPKHPLLDQEQG